MKIQEIAFDRLVVEQGEWAGGRDEVGALAASIEQAGLLLPPIVQAVEDGRPRTWRVLAGKRRHRAIAAIRERRPDFMAKVPCLLLPGEAREAGLGAAEVALIENTLRRGLDPFEEGDLYVRAGKPAAELALLFGVGEGRVQRRRQLARLIEPLRRRHREGAISLRVAQRLACFDPALQAHADAAYPGTITAWQVERLLEEAYIPAEAALFDVAAAGLAVERLLFPPAHLAEDEEGWCRTWIKDRAGFRLHQHAALRAMAPNPRAGLTVVPPPDSPLADPDLLQEIVRAGLRADRPEGAWEVCVRCVLEERPGWEEVFLPLSAAEWNALQPTADGDALLTRIETVLAGMPAGLSGNDANPIPWADGADPSPAGTSGLVPAPGTGTIWSRRQALTRPLTALAEAFWARAIAHAVETRPGFAPAFLAAVLAFPGLRAAGFETATLTCREGGGKREECDPELAGWAAAVDACRDAAWPAALPTAAALRAAALRLAGPAPEAAMRTAALLALAALRREAIRPVADALGVGAAGLPVAASILAKLGKAELREIARTWLPGRRFTEADAKSRLVSALHRAHQADPGKPLPGFLRLAADEAPPEGGGAGAVEDVLEEALPHGTSLHGEEGVMRPVAA